MNVLLLFFFKFRTYISNDSVNGNKAYHKKIWTTLKQRKGSHARKVEHFKNRKTVVGLCMLNLYGGAEDLAKKVVKLGCS